MFKGTCNCCYRYNLLCHETTVNSVGNEVSVGKEENKWEGVEGCRQGIERENEGRRGNVDKELKENEREG